MKCLINSYLNAENESVFSERRGINVAMESDRRNRTDRRQMNIPVEVDRRKSDRRGVNGLTSAKESSQIDKKGGDSSRPDSQMHYMGTRVENIPVERRNRTERRQVNIPVENDRRKGERREEKGKDVSFVNDKRHQNQEPERKELFFEACEALPPLRRLKALPDQLENGNGTTALGMASLALINLPEDLRDIGQSVEQIKYLYKGKKFKGAYDYKDYQHPFSFFRGTMLHKWLLKNLDQGKKWALWLADNDISLDKTAFGKKVLNSLNVKTDKNIETEIKDLFGGTEAAVSHKGSVFGKLTARAMRRTTLPGLTAIGILEIPKIIHAMTKGDTAKDKAVSTGKQGIKSAINVASITAGIGYMGALGAKYGGPTGSIVGMGLGAVLGSKLSQRTQKNIS